MTAPAAAPPRRPKLWTRLRNSRFFWISVAVHVLFFLVAGYLVVQTISAERKLTFKGGPPSPNPSKRAMEHKVQLAKKKNSMSAPAQPKRVLTTGVSKVSLPEMPALATTSLASPGKMAGLGGTSLGLGASGAPGGGNGSGGGGLPYFGLRASGAGLEGTFYDFKREARDKPVEKPIPFAELVKSFASGNWGPQKYKNYKSPTKLYSKVFFFPAIKDTEAGTAFQAPESQPGNWIAHYKGVVIPGDTGTYRFVGFGDNLMCVKLGGDLVLDASDHSYLGKAGVPVGRVDLPGKPNTPVFAGSWFTVGRGQSQPIDILLGDEGGIFCAGLFIQKQGTDFTAATGAPPNLPLFIAGTVSDAEKAALRKFLPDSAFAGPPFALERSIFSR